MSGRDESYLFPPCRTHGDGTRVGGKDETFSGAYNHYLNNATATIQGHAQLIKIRSDKGEIVDTGATLERGLEVMHNSVEMIGAVLRAIEEVTHIETTEYHNELEILDIEKLVNDRKQELECLAESLEVTPPTINS